MVNGNVQNLTREQIIFIEGGLIVLTVLTQITFHNGDDD